MKRIVLVLLLLISFCGSSQETLTIKYFGLTVHPFGDNQSHLQPHRLDERAVVVVNKGIFVGFEKFFYKDLFSVKAVQGITTDCSSGMASISHLGLRVLLMRTKKHKVYFGIGPTLLVRESWTRFGDNYTSSGYFNEYNSAHFGVLQWKFIPYGLEFEYDYCLTPKDNLSISLTPGIPAATIMIGWKHWFSLPEHEPYKLYIPKKRK